MDNRTKNMLNRYVDKFESDILDFYVNEYGDEYEDSNDFIDFFNSYNVSDYYAKGTSVFLETYDSFGYASVTIELTKKAIRVELDGISMSTNLPADLCYEAFNDVLDYCLSVM